MFDNKTNQNQMKHLEIKIKLTTSKLIRKTSMVILYYYYFWMGRRGHGILLALCGCVCIIHLNSTAIAVSAAIVAREDITATTISLIGSRVGSG